MRPIFIGGCPRSGTTLLGAMLGGSATCVTTPESQFKVDELRRVSRLPESEQARRLLERIARSWRFRAWETPVAADHLESIGADDSCADVMTGLVAAYADFVGKPDVSCWVDHTPENIRCLATLFGLFPDARAIHLVRDGRAVAASVLPLEWGPNTILGAARDWAEHVAFGLAAESAFGAERVVQVRYEELVANPGTVISRLCEWLEVPFEDRMLHADGFTKPSYYDYRAHEHIGHKPDPGLASAWDEKLEPGQVELFESHAGELLAYLGYSLKHGLDARPVRGLDLVKSHAAELVAEIVNRLRGRYKIRSKVSRG